MPKREIFAHTECFRPQSFYQVLADKRLRTQRRKFLVEPHNKNELDPHTLDQSQFLLEGADQPRRMRRCENAYGVGVKRQNCRNYTELARPLDHSFQNCLMSQMETIKITDGQNAGAVSCRIGQAGNDFHRGMIIRNDWGKVRKAH